MSFAQQILPEFDQEMASTRKVLERLPDEKLDWKPHPKSNTIGWNANHVAEMLGWALDVLTTPSFDIAAPGKPPYQAPKHTSRREILDLFDRNLAKARQALAATTDDQAAQPWRLLKGGQELITMPRAGMIRSFVMNHIIHHRAVLCVYLRLNNLPVPGMYGPSGDEQ